MWLSTLPFLLAIPMFVWKLRRPAPIGGRPPGAGERTALIVRGTLGASAVCGVVVLLAPMASNIQSQTSNPQTSIRMQPPGRPL